MGASEEGKRNARPLPNSERKNRKKASELRKRTRRCPHYIKMCDTQSAMSGNVKKEGYRTN